MDKKRRLPARPDYPGPWIQWPG